MLSPMDQQVISSLKHCNTPLGVVAVLNFSQPFPQGWVRLSFPEAQGFIDQLKPLLDEWSIVAFQQGKMSGPGYNYEIQQTYGEECG